MFCLFYSRPTPYQGECGELNFILFRVKLVPKCLNNISAKNQMFI